jgi:hypothetical protein
MEQSIRFGVDEFHGMDHPLEPVIGRPRPDLILTEH